MRFPSTLGSDWSTSTARRTATTSRAVTLTAWARSCAPLVGAATAVLDGAVKVSVTTFRAASQVAWRSSSLRSSPAFRLQGADVLTTDWAKRANVTSPRPPTRLPATASPRLAKTWPTPTSAP